MGLSASDNRDLRRNLSLLTEVGGGNIKCNYVINKSIKLVTVIII